MRKLCKVVGGARLSQRTDTSRLQCQLGLASLIGRRVDSAGTQALQPIDASLQELGDSESFAVNPFDLFRKLIAGEG